MVEVASSSVVGLAFAKETTYGVLDPSHLVWQKLRYTGESFAQEQQTVTSQEINDDRQTSDLIRTDLGAGGSLNFEFSHTTYDKLLIALFHEDTENWIAGEAVNVASSTITLPGGVITISGDWSTLAAGPDQRGKFCEVVVRAAPAGAIEQRAACRLVTATATEATVDFGTLVAASSKDITITIGKMITNGTKRQSFSFQRHFKDAEGGPPGNHAYNLGMSPNNMTLQIAAGAVITGNFDFVGSKETANVTTLITGGDPSAVTTTKVMNGVDSIEGLLEGGATFRLSRMDITIGNNIEAHKAVGLLGALELTSGQLAVSGSMQAYFKTKAQFDKFLNFTDTSLVIKFRDQNNKIYVLQIPDMKFTGGRRNAGGINQPVIADLQFGAIKDPTLLKTMRLFSIESA